MIPKIIHYCWFGGNPKPKLSKKCIRSWKKFCPDYQIIEWNEENFDLSSTPLYVRQAYEAKKWAFVTDWIRLKVVYDYGGIYLDTDVELLKNLDSLLTFDAYFGFERGTYINTGLGFGAVKNAPILEELMQDYADIPFLLPDRSYDATPCPVRNTKILQKHGLLLNDSLQLIDGKIQILPTICLSPKIFHASTDIITEDTISIHWYAGSWCPEEERLEVEQLRETQKQKRKKLQQAERMDRLIHLPNRLTITLLGSHRYAKLKKFIKRSK